MVGKAIPKLSLRLPPDYSERRVCSSFLGIKLPMRFFMFPFVMSSAAETSGQRLIMLFLCNQIPPRGSALVGMTRYPPT